MSSEVVNPVLQRFSRQHVVIYCKHLCGKGLDHQDIFSVKDESTQQRDRDERIAIGDRVDILLEAVHHSNAMAARLTGFEAKTIGEWRNGKRRPQVDNIATLARAIGYDVSDALRYVFKGGAAAIPKTPEKSDQPPIVERQIESRTKAVAGARPPDADTPADRERRAMWEELQKVKLKLAEQVVLVDDLRDENADLKETIRGLEARMATAARVKATPKPPASVKPAVQPNDDDLASRPANHIVDRILTPELLASGNTKPVKKKPTRAVRAG